MVGSDSGSESVVGFGSVTMVVRGKGLSVEMFGPGPVPGSGLVVGVRRGGEGQGRNSEAGGVSKVDNTRRGWSVLGMLRG